jgi:hypothetical protein
MFFLYFILSVIHNMYFIFRSCFVLFFLVHVVSSLAYPNLLRTKILGCCCCDT